jgi:hypothetical protein
MEVASMTKCPAIAITLAITLLSTGSAVAQTANPPVPIEYSGTTAGLAPGSGFVLTFRIFNWSTADDRQRVLQVLTSASKENSGLPDLTKLLASHRSMGQIWTEGPGGYALKYTHREELPDGGQRIVVITDRPIGALNPPGPWKADGQTTDVAPFTVIEMHVSKDGKGEGKMSLGVPFTIDPGDHTVDLSNYAAAPVTIRNVQLRRGAAGGY